MSDLTVFCSRAGMNYVAGNIINLKTGNTEKVAAEICALTGAGMLKIESACAFPFDYNESLEQACCEQKRNARPAIITELPEELSEVRTLYFGYPIFWGTFPMVMYTFLEYYEFGRICIRPFCTHEGSGFGRSLGDLKHLAPGAKICKGLAIEGAQVVNHFDLVKEDIKKWLKI